MINVILKHYIALQVKLRFFLLYETLPSENTNCQYCALSLTVANMYNTIDSGFKMKKIFVF